MRPSPSQSRGVLIVDPDPYSRTELADALTAAGWAVWATGDPADAVREYVANRDRIDVALVDLQLPGLTGARVLAELARVAPDLPRWATTAPVRPHAAVAFERMCGTPLLAKPVRPDRIASLLGETRAIAN